VVRRSEPSRRLDSRPRYGSLSGVYTAGSLRTSMVRRTGRPALEAARDSHSGDLGGSCDQR
jgi:hypothetical protein